MKTRVVQKIDHDGTVRYVVQMKRGETDDWVVAKTHHIRAQALEHAMLLATPEKVVMEFGE